MAPPAAQGVAARVLHPLEVGMPGKGAHHIAANGYPPGPTSCCWTSRRTTSTRTRSTRSSTPSRPSTEASSWCAPPPIRDSRFAIRAIAIHASCISARAAFSRRRAIRGAPGEPRPAFHQQHGVGAVGRRRCAKGGASDSGRVSGIQGVAAQIARRRWLGACFVVQLLAWNA
jgi:hypothetical protein